MKISISFDSHFDEPICIFKSLESFCGVQLMRDQNDYQLLHNDQNYYHLLHQIYMNKNQKVLKQLSVFQPQKDVSETML